jgi:hypothetical protein
LGQGSQARNGGRHSHSEGACGIGGG